MQEFFEDIRDKDGTPFFKRRFTFDAPQAEQAFYFRAATGRKIKSSSDRSFVIDQLQLRITTEHAGIVRPGDTGEVLIRLTLPKGQSSLTLEYQW